MLVYVFGCINDRADNTYGYRIEARDYLAAQQRLFVYLVIDDYYGYVTTFRNVLDNFKLRDINDHEIDVTNWLIKRGITRDTNITVADYG